MYTINQNYTIIDPEFTALFSLIFNKWYHKLYCLYEISTYVYEYNYSNLYWGPFEI